MKTKKSKLKKLGSIVLLSLTTLTQSPQSYAKGEEGYFVGNRRTSDGEEVRVEVFVKKILDTQFGLMIESGNPLSAGLFKIETLADQTQAWVQIKKNSDGKVLTQAPSYQITFMVTSTGNELKFVPTPDFPDCSPYEMSVERSDNKKWNGVLKPKAVDYVSGSSKVDVSFTSANHIGALNGKLVIGEHSQTGHRLIEEQIPSIMTLRAAKVDLASSAQHVLSPTIEGFLTVITEHKSTGFLGLGSGKDANRIVVSTGQSSKLSCLPTATVLNVK